jgi:hypothetical protein
VGFGLMLQGGDKEGPFCWLKQVETEDPMELNQFFDYLIFIALIVLAERT